MKDCRLTVCLFLFLVGNKYWSDAFSFSSTTTISVSNRNIRPTTVLTTQVGSTIITSDVPLLEPLEEPADDSTGAMMERKLLQRDSFLEDATRILLDPVSYPPGQLPSEVISSSFHILHSWALTHSVHGAEMVTRILTRLEEEIQAGSTTTTTATTGGIELTNKHYTVAVQAWGKSGHVEAAQRAEDALNRMVDLAQSNPHLAPNRVAVSMVMGAYVKQGDVQRAADLLERMRVTLGVEPLTNDYNMLLIAYAQSGQARKAEEIMKRMVDQCREVNSNASAPDLVSYNMLLDAWAKSGESGAGERAQQILTELQRQCISGETPFQPDVRTYSHVANAILRSGGKTENVVNSAFSNVVAAAENILDQAEAMGITPDVYLHSTLLDAYASSSELGSATKAEERLNAMERQGMANSVAYNTVIKAWKQSPDHGAAQRAEAILRRMEVVGMADTISYTTVIAAYGIKGDKQSAMHAEELYERMARAYEEGNTLAKPNTQTLNALLNAWVKCGNVDRAEQILFRMERASYEEDVHAGVAPNVVSYSTVMNGWAKSGDKDAVCKAQQLFDRMNKMYQSGNHDARPNLFTYTTLIDAIAKSGDPGAPLKAQDIVFMMYEEYKKGNQDVKPNAQIITSLIECWQKSGDPNAGERAEALLNWMINISRKENDPSLEPNEYTFSSVISAWGKSRRFGKATHARSILQTMIDLHESGRLQAKPNTHCFTAVINCCAYSEKEAAEKHTALQIAGDTFHELCQKPKYGAPNHVTYSSLMTAIRNLTPPSDQRSATICKLFRKCCQDGQVNDLVVKRMQSALTLKQLKELFGDAAVTEDGQVTMSIILPEWRCNIPKTNSTPSSRKYPVRNPLPQR